MEIKLSELKIGEKATVVKVVTEGLLRRRLYDMGITPSCEVVIKKHAPLGDPMQLSLRGYELTIRKADAENIIVEKVSDGGDK